MPDNRPITIKYALVCDDTRREDNGKLILIGVYGANVLVNSFPARLILALAIICETKERGPIPCEFRVLVGDQGKQIGKAGITFDQTGKSIFVVKPIPVEIPGPTSLTFQIKQTEFDWETIIEMPVGLMPTTSSAQRLRA